MIRRTIAVSAAALSLTILVSSCSSSKKPTATPTPTTSAATSSAATTPSTSSAPAVPATKLFGPGCATLGLTDQALAPAVGAPVATVVGQVPFLSSVISASNAAGLTSTLNAAPALTVFAPVNDAFKKEPPAQVQALLTDPSKRPLLIATLKFHILSGKVEKAGLPGKHVTLNGQSITITGSGDSFTINGKAKVICGGIETKNAVVYLIDTVLHPAG